MTAQTLVLTQAYTPHKVINWQDAICMLYLDKVEVVDEYDEEIRAPSITMRMPAVVRLKRGVGSVKRGVKFSKVNVLTRDGFKCQYCGFKGTIDELNYDHVIPRAQGGKTVWENIVACCYSCNSKKANRTPAQAGMSLRSRPHRPKTLPMVAPIIRTINPAWEIWVGKSHNCLSAEVSGGGASAP